MFALVWCCQTNRLGSISSTFGVKLFETSIIPASWPVPTYCHHSNKQWMNWLNAWQGSNWVLKNKQLRNRERGLLICWNYNRVEKEIYIWPWTLPAIKNSNDDSILDKVLLAFIPVNFSVIDFQQRKLNFKAMTKVCTVWIRFFGSLSSGSCSKSNKVAQLSLTVTWENE